MGKARAVEESSLGKGGRQRGGLCLGGGQLRNTSALQGQLMQRMEDVPKSKEPSDVGPQGWPAGCSFMQLIKHN